MRRAAGWAFLLTAISCSQRPPGLRVQSAIQAELTQIRAIDNHAHPQSVPASGALDRNFDALPADAIQEPSLPTPFRPDSPYFPEAWHALFHYSYTDSSKEHMRSLQGEREAVMREKGDLYPAWVLNRADTDIMLANREAMGRGLPPDRFKWVPFADMFLFPLNNQTSKSRDPEHRAFFDSEEALLRAAMQKSETSRRPAAMDDYLTFVSHTLESWKAEGAVAVKFEIAYLRDLAISNPSRETAARTYAIYAQSSEPPPEDYKVLQDFIFRFIARDAGRLNLPVHIHCALGGGSYYNQENAHAFKLESLFDDPTLRRTKFVMLHGSWPFAAEAAALILKPNVYVDFSGLSYLTYPAQAARAIRLYLEAAPEKVLYGSDASPLSENIGWEETAWIGARTGRLALGLALTGMLEDGEISRDRALQLAHMAMRENARALYRF